MDRWRDRDADVFAQYTRLPHGCRLFHVRYAHGSAGEARPPSPSRWLLGRYQQDAVLYSSRFIVRKPVKMS